MHAEVFLESVLLGETLGAHITHVGLLSAVLALVCPPRLTVQEGLVAEGTSEGTLTCVSAHV